MTEDINPSELQENVIYKELKFTFSENDWISSKDQIKKSKKKKVINKAKIIYMYRSTKKKCQSGEIIPFAKSLDEHPDIIYRYSYDIDGINQTHAYKDEEPFDSNLKSHSKNDHILNNEISTENAIIDPVSTIEKES